MGFYPFVPLGPSLPISIANGGTGQVTAAAGLAALGGLANSPDPVPPWIASDSGWLAMNVDPVLGVTSNAIPSAGAIYLWRINIRQAISVTNVVMFLNAVGVTLTSNECFVGLYNSAGTLIAASADQSANWAANGGAYHVMPLVGGPYAVPAGFVWVGFVQNNTGTGPSFGRPTATNGAGSNGGVSAALSRAAKNGSGTVLPASITPASNAQDFPWLAALS